MGMRSSTISVSKLPIEISWECSNCGATNMEKVQLESFGQGGYYPVSQGSERSTEEARSQAEDMLSMDLFSIAVNRKQDFSFYRQQGFNCKCSVCGHKEPWAMPALRFGKILSLGSSLVGIIIIIAILWLVTLPGSDNAGAQVLLVAGILALLIVPYLIFKENRVGKMKELKTENFPRLVTEYSRDAIVSVMNFEQSMRKWKTNSNVPVNRTYQNQNTLSQNPASGGVNYAGNSAGVTADAGAVTNPELKQKIFNGDTTIEDPNSQNNNNGGEECIFCNKCGKRLPPDSQFCFKCGNRLPIDF